MVFQEGGRNWKFSGWVGKDEKKALVGWDKILLFGLERWLVKVRDSNDMTVNVCLMEAIDKYPDNLMQQRRSPAGQSWCFVRFFKSAVPVCGFLTVRKFSRQ